MEKLKEFESCKIKLKAPLEKSTLGIFFILWHYGGA